MDHVVLESECIDRMYLNAYVPQLQRVGGVVWYLRGHLGQRFASMGSVAPKTVAFVARIEKFAAGQGVDLVSFGKHQRNDDITRQYLQQVDASEGILYVGRVQEKARVVRTGRAVVVVVHHSAAIDHPRIAHAGACVAVDAQLGVIRKVPHRLRGAGQRHSFLQGPRGAATNLRWARWAQDRSAAA